MHIQDLQVDLTLHPNDWEGFKALEDHLLDADSEKASTTNEVIVERLSDKKYFRVEYTQYRNGMEYEDEVKEVFPVTKTITVMSVPSINEFVNKQSLRNFEFEEGYFIDEEDFRKALKEFAALHVQAALEAASEVLVIDLDNMSKEAILNAYPLTNIK